LEKKGNTELGSIIPTVIKKETRGDSISFAEKEVRLTSINTALVMFALTMEFIIGLVDRWHLLDCERFACFPRNEIGWILKL